MSGAMIAIHAAAAAAAREKVLTAFRVNEATTPDRARSFAELGIAADDKYFSALIVSGTVRGVGPRNRPVIIGDPLNTPVAFYLDEAALIAERERSGRSTMKALRVIMIGLGLLALVGIALLFAFGSEIDLAL